MRSILATFVLVGFVPRPNQHFISPSLQTYTSAPHSFREILISIPQATFIPFSPKLFSTHFQWYVYIFCGEFTPKESIAYRQSGKHLHLIGAMFRRTANTRIKPRKPLVFFIVGLFWVAIKKTQKVFKIRGQMSSSLQQLVFV
jgi:hypothetical protein